MATPQSPNLTIAETQVFVLSMRLAKRALIILLLSGTNSTPATQGTITLDVAPPATIARMPAGTWAKLWPTKAEPPGWSKVTYMKGKITVTTKTSATGEIGGIIAFLGPESSLPVNLKTQVTYLNDDALDATITSTERSKWDTIFAGMTPRLPLPRVTTVAKQALSSARPTRYTRKRPSQATTRPAAPTTTTRPTVPTPPAVPTPPVVPSTTPPSAPLNTSPVAPPVAAPEVSAPVAAPEVSAPVAAPEVSAPVAAPEVSAPLSPTTSCPYMNYGGYDNSYSSNYYGRRMPAYRRDNKMMYTIAAIIVFVVLGLLLWFTMVKYSSMNDVTSNAAQSAKNLASTEKPVF